MEKQIKKTLKIALIFLAIGLLLGTIIVFAATPSTTFYISSGVYPGAPSYTIWREGSNYFAKDSTGQIDYSGTNATDIIQNCVASDISLVIIGAITLDGEIFLDDNMLIDLTNAEIIQDRAGFDYNAFLVAQGKHNIRIVGGEYDGNRAGGSTHHGIVIEQFSTNVTVQNVKIHNVWGSGIAVINSSYCKIVNNHIWDCGNPTTHYGPGIRLDGASHRNLISGNTIFENNEHGIKEYGDCEENIISNNIVDTTYKTGISCSGLRSEVSENILRNCNWSSIYLSDSGYATVTGNTIFNDNVGGYNNYAITGYSNNIISFNRIYGCYNGIHALSNSSVVGNWVYDATYYSIHTVGNYTVANSNIVRSTVNTARGIRIQNTYYSVFVGNSLVDLYYGIEELTSDYNVITSSDTHECTNGIIIVGGNTKVNLCWNASSWIA